jgi:exodeoxyribonuclease V gamma subunit
MKPMRGLPFRQVCLLGMQAKDFPRRSPNTEFDRMASDWRHGDPRPGDEDRYLFLEALLAAQQGLSISYTGRDPKDNSVRQPSVLVRELMDYLDERFVAPADDDGKAPPFSTTLTIIHPLQAYSQRNFRDPDSASFDGYWRQVGERVAAQSPRAAVDYWPQQRLPALPEPLTELPLEQLRRFINHPPRYFAQTRLGSWLGDDDPRPEDDERFGLDGLQGWFMRQTLMQDWLRGSETTRDWFDARGELPHGGLGGLEFSDINTSSSAWLAQLQDYRRQPAEARLIDLSIAVEGYGELQISGQLQQFYPGLGLLHASYSKFKGKHLLDLWLDYLLLVAQSGPGMVPAARLFCRDQALAIKQPLSRAQAREGLAGLSRLYLDGLQDPPLILPAASFAYACVEDPDVGMKAAAKAWHSGDFVKTPGDDEDPYIRLLCRGVQGSPLQHPDFPRLARQLYRPALMAVGLAAAGGA